MSTQLPEDEAKTIPWEGGEENKGDEPGETPDPHKVTEVAVDDVASEKVEQEKADEGEDDDF